MVQLTERESLLSQLLFEAGERVHATHANPDDGFIITCTTSTLCQRIMAVMLAQMEDEPDRPKEA